MSAPLSPLARARIAVALTGLVCAAVLALSLALIGGPETGRRDRRDVQRVSDLREIAEALICHGGQEGAGRPVTLADISPACLSPDAAARLLDPASRAPYAISWTDARTARVCGLFERAHPSWTQGWPPFDAATGCVTAALR